MQLPRLICICLFMLLLETRITEQKEKEIQLKNKDKKLASDNNNDRKINTSFGKSGISKEISEDDATKELKVQNATNVKIYPMKSMKKKEQIYQQTPVMNKIKQNRKQLKNQIGKLHISTTLSNQSNFIRKINNDTLRKKKENIDTVSPRNASANMITDIRVANMGQAMYGGSNSNSSKSSENISTTSNSTQTNQTSAKIASLLHALGDDDGASVGIKNDFNDYLSSAKDVNAQKKQIIGPGYYEPECDDEKKCADGHYCEMYVCIECHRIKHACTDRVQCCNGMECVYGRCENKPKGSPGSFCHEDKDCSGEACCVLEPTIDEHESICKPKLSEYHQCSPILFRKIWIGDNKPDCGPCKDGLRCSQRGNDGNHEVCIKKP